MTAAPDHVAILGLGPSLQNYVDLVKRIGWRLRFADEIWGINAVGGVILCDRLFHMDDVRIQEARAKELPDSNIANMLKWMRTHQGPIYTSRVHPDYPGLVAYPLEDVINSVGVPYFNSTAAYAVAYAVHLGVKKISLFGLDFTYPNSHHAEKGRACVEFFLGIAIARGIEINISDHSTLMDAGERDHFYGYDTLSVRLDRTPEGLGRVSFEPRDDVPTAREIEHRYDHSRPANTLVEQGA
jgi:hypothetical protein